MSILNLLKHGGMRPVLQQAAEDEFSSALASGFDVEPPAEEPPADEPPVEELPADEPPEEPPEDEPATDEPADQPADQPAGGGTGEEPPVDAPAAPETTHSGLTANEIAAAIREANRMEAADAAEAERERVATEAAAKGSQALTIDDYLSEADKKALETYDSEWSEVSAAEQIRTKAAVSMAVAQLRKEFGTALAPIVASVQRSQTTSLRAQVLAAHPDLDTYIEPVKQWVSEQPTIVRGAYENVVKKGSAEDIIELLNLYKASGVPRAEPPPTASTPAPNAASVRRQAAAKATAAVTTAQRGKPALGPDGQDFESALAEALNGN